MKKFVSLKKKEGKAYYFEEEEYSPFYNKFIIKHFKIMF